MADQQMGVVLLHAYTGSPIDMNFISRALIRGGYLVEAPLFAGHGTSEPLDILTLGNPEKWWHQTEQAITQLKERTSGPIAVFGLSLGGIFAMQALSAQPTLRCGGIFGTPILPFDDSAVQAAFIDYAKVRYQRAKLATNVVEEKLKQVAELLPQQMASIKAAGAIVAPALGRLQQPIFLGQGGQDDLVPPRQMLGVAAQLVNSAVTYQSYPKAGHVITVNSAHRVLEKDVLQFCNRNEEINS